MLTGNLRSSANPKKRADSYKENEDNRSDRTKHVHALSSNSWIANCRWYCVQSREANLMRRNTHDVNEKSAAVFAARMGLARSATPGREQPGWSPAISAGRLAPTPDEQHTVVPQTARDSTCGLHQTRRYHAGLLPTVPQRTRHSRRCWSSARPLPSLRISGRQMTD